MQNPRAFTVRSGFVLSWDLQIVDSIPTLLRSECGLKAMSALSMEGDCNMLQQLPRRLVVLREDPVSRAHSITENLKRGSSNEERRMNMPALFDLTGRVAVVTGGNGGIGRGIALGLAEAGASVAIFGRNEAKNQHVLAELKAMGVASIAVKIDLTQRHALEPALARVASELGDISILVNNAGNVSLSGGILQEKPEDWDNVIETQLNSVFLLSKLAAQSMMSHQAGKIINIGSMYSFFGSGLIPSYSAAKGAIIQLTKSMAIELAPHNIQVNAIAPGWIETDMTAPVKTMPLNDEILSRTPAGRWGQSEEIAGTAVYLASRASNFVTGATIRVDGGYSIR